MRVLLAGATGTIGKALVSHLISAGHEVIGLTRSEPGLQRLHAAGAEPVRASLMDADELLTALDGYTADAAIHQATSITGTPLFHRALYATDALRDKGTTNLIQAAQLVGARRFVTQSFFLGYGYRDHGTELITEDRPFAQLTGHGPTDRHMRALRSNEDQVLGTPGIDGIALRYGMFYGPEPLTRQLADQTKSRRLPVPRPSGVTSLIHIHDAAAAAVAALERGRPGQAYNIVDDHPVAFSEYIEALAEASGAPSPRSVPAWLLAAFPYMHGLMVTTRIRLSNARAKHELGWKPVYPSIHEGLTTLWDTD
ncbi:NAD-dependent epimerase/dehydratase family protein [Nocardia wallacei]|uniref:NAD-dependent epimerase/dehydratase family protein n=1 Tax=Nocardia wallacei TaxID=480035 RepID=UPI0024568E10|nr:NAD(P)-dependent oxidoreductase [Nocardia wallacei]